MSSTTATQFESATRALTTRARIVSSLGPLTIAGGIAWAIIQPWRITLLHPDGQGFWWLFVEPPLLVAVAGIAFHLLVARPLLQDLEAAD
jgi:hypothetical protein